MELSVEELAGRAGVSVDTIRFYQGRRLIPAPQKRGRRAVYGSDHVQLLDRIADLKAKGLSLRLIARVLGQDLDVDLDGASGRKPGLTLSEMSNASGVPVAVLQEALDNGLLSPIGNALGEARFHPEEAEAARMAMALVEAGLPLADLTELAQSFDRAIQPLASKAVDLFLEHVGLDGSGESLDRLNALLDAAALLSGRTFRQALVREADSRTEGRDV